MPIPVALTRQPDYEPAALLEAVDRAFSAIGFAPSRGERVLVKPNLVAARGPALACTEPAMARAACSWLLDHGCEVAAGDSPAFGSARGVAAKVGLLDVLDELGVPLMTLDTPQALPLTQGGGVGLSSLALACDRILNLPRLKAHGQMRVSAGVKNLFGCVTGMRKALAHSRFGDQGTRFESLILDVAMALPPVTTLLDAVRCMHRDGPIGGAPLDLGFLAASPDPVALDTAVYGLLSLAPGDVALWREARDRDLPGAFAENLAFPLDAPDGLDASAFQVPQALRPVTFHPLRLARGAVLRLFSR
ncbi:DUF362 domain-containing protein [Desulfocurvus sp. DL9XJH121]